MPMVLVHGGGLGKECWDRFLPHLDGDAVAVDLPGRGDRPGDLSTIHVADFVDAVVDELVSRDLHDVVLVGHSLAGLTIPQVAGRVPERIRALVFVSCTVPRDGQTTYDTLDPEIQALSDGAPSEAVGALDPEIATAVFYNDVTDPAVLDWGLSLLLPEAPADLRRVWIRLTNDVIVAPEKQDRYVENLGGCEVLELDAGHMAMISRPRDLAALLTTI
jgi:pimeloyl-ACP methyl ester carboxylesterase